MPRQETKQETRTLSTVRPLGISFASLFYAAAGIYYLAFPVAMQDYSLWYLFGLGAVSLVSSFGIYRMLRWGLWLGLLLYLPHLIVPATTLLTAISSSGVFQEPIAVAFILSLIILMFFATIAFLLLLDKRHDFKTNFW